ncbi:MAG: OmpA family protein [Bacteroidales bacterium]|nr:OmpA family protein [Bacteroidales bacterium]
MRKVVLLTAAVAISSAAMAQAPTTPIGITIPEGYQTTSFYISGNGEKAIAGFKKDESVKFLLYEKQGDKFSEGEAVAFLDQLIADKKNPTTPSLNHDGTRIYFSAKNEKGNNDIFYSTKDKDKWTEPENMGEAINSSADEIYPSVSSDGLSIYFTRPQNDAKDSRCGTIYSSSRTPYGEWEEAVALVEPLNLGCETAPYIAPDNKTLYISSMREGGKGGFDIYYANKVSPLYWILPIALDTINSSNDELFPVYNANSNKLSLLYRDPKNKKNISFVDVPLSAKLLPADNCRYYGKILDQETQQPMTANIEVSDAFSSGIIATFTNDNETGIYDFVLPRDKRNVFIDYSAPNYSHTILDKDVTQDEEKIDASLFKNVQLSLNVFDQSMFDPLETNITIKVDGVTENITPETIDVGRYKMTLPIGKYYKIYLTQNLYEDYVMDFDLTHKVQFQEFERDAELVSKKEEITINVEGVTEPIEIEITNLSTKDHYVTTVTTDRHGKAVIPVRKGDKYEIHIMPKGYSFYNGTLDLSADNNRVLNAKIEKLQADTKMELDNITFASNSADIAASSYEELNRLVDLLKLNPQFKVELSAHTDDKGADAYNMKLSDRRANSVVNYLKLKGIPSNRLVAKGYGKTMPLVPNNSDENRAINRRVEFKIIGTDL